MPQPAIYMLSLHLFRSQQPLRAPSMGTERALLLTTLFSCLHFSIGIMLKGSVTCSDCSPSYDLSGVRIAVECASERMPYYAVTNAKGRFEVDISSRSSSHRPANCTANLLGGTTQLCAFEKSMASHVVSVNSGGESCGALQSPLAFFTSCGKNLARSRVVESGRSGRGKAAVVDQKEPSGGSTPPSRTPTTGGRSSIPPTETYGLPPLIYIFPFVPIIGIP